ncbi:hypothetical protein J1614_000059 [Plenodomus biglobosus]|nr:hypothetical protein J1614_000059 [Plenodomus biglobosus]
MSRSVILEVERKFPRLTVADLTPHVGSPPFRRIQPQGVHRFKDTYFDRSGLLTASGLWVRLRDERWEAKVRKGGDFQNSRFEELFDPSEIGRRVHAITGQACNQHQFFGLECTAVICTTRRAWVADDRFKIVLDSMDFGHEVGEVELQSEVQSAHAGQELEEHKQRVMQQMDEEIVRFMERYRWAFASGVPIGKLAAYFERQASGNI